MSTFLILIMIAVTAVVLFDLIYFLPSFKKLEESEKKIK